MRLSKAIARNFVCIRGNNLFSAVCRAMGCELLEPGSNYAGNVTNIWSYPQGASGKTEKIRVRLTPGQLKRWNNRHKILRDCQDKASPVVALVRETLARTTESERFKTLADSHTRPGERNAVKSWRKNPIKMTKTKNGDILHPVARLPPHLRRELLIGGMPVREFDVKSAHAVLLGMFYRGKTSPPWIEERERYRKEAANGFISLYGANKEYKVDFLAALNQPAHVARNASHGYRNLERFFPLLAEELEAYRSHFPKKLGSLLRSSLASIMTQSVSDIHSAGFFALPVTDSLLVACPPGREVQSLIQSLKRRLEAASGIAPVVCEKL